MYQNAPWELPFYLIFFPVYDSRARATHTRTHTHAHTHTLARSLDHRCDRGAPLPRSIGTPSQRLIGRAAVDRPTARALVRRPVPRGSRPRSLPFARLRPALRPHRHVAATASETLLDNRTVLKCPLPPSFPAAVYSREVRRAYSTAARLAPRSRWVSILRIVVPDAFVRGYFLPGTAGVRGPPTDGLLYPSRPPVLRSLSL